MNLKDSKMYRDVMRAYPDKEARCDIMHYGGVSGAASRHIYYKDTCKWYERYKAEIWDLLWDCAEESGCENPCEFIATLGGVCDVGSSYQFENLLCWFAVEECCRASLEE